MGVWDWFRHRRRSHRLAEASSYQQQNLTDREEPTFWPFSSCFSTRGHALPMIRSCPPPKCLSRLPCSQILLGERLEDFSPDCWLENHLHRFGEIEDFSHDCWLENHFHRFNERGHNRSAMPDLENGDDSTTGSSDSDNDTEVESDHSVGTLSDLDSDIFRERQRLWIEDLFMSPEERDAIIDSPCGYRQVVEPPPYSEHFNEPPPTYAEAVGHENDGGSISGRSSSNDSTTFLW